jgi:hypothetical protein
MGRDLRIPPFLLANTENAAALRLSIEQAVRPAAGGVAMEKRLLFGMAGVVLAVLFAFLTQALTDARGCAIGPCDPVAGAIHDSARG